MSLPSEKDRPLVSVVIPTRNRFSMLEEAVDCVLKQTYPNLEIFIVDDGSENSTIDRIKNLTSKDKRIRLLRHIESKGASAARQTGLNEAQGTYTAFLDDDDLWLPQKIERQVEVMERDKGLSGVSCWYLMDYYGRQIQVAKPLEMTVGSLQWFNVLGSFSFCLFQTNLRGKGLGLDLQLKSRQDWDFWLSLASLGTVGIVCDYLAVYRVHDKGRITTNYANYADGTLCFLEKYWGSQVSPQRFYHLGSYYKFVARTKRFGNGKYKNALRACYYYHHSGLNSQKGIRSMLHIFFSLMIPTSISKMLRRLWFKKVPRIVEFSAVKKLTDELKKINGDSKFDPPILNLS